jgi:predicted HD phosphohydrolase
MKTQYGAIPCWSTTSNSQGADNSPVEAMALLEHLGHCKKPYGRLYAAVCAADAMHGFAASRFVTTLVVFVALIFVGSLVI